MNAKVKKLTIYKLPEYSLSCASFTAPSFYEFESIFLRGVLTPPSRYTSYPEQATAIQTLSICHCMQDQSIG